ncbi:DUF2244 domain-containing protein [Pseudorhodoferax soli]|uniref:Putative membrane protein n=1 Tax=Pseudorhodoferax soli TaxID=545864 RepID=A0A368XYF8_9BURK|nr:DUF2244 domain-containing protein [Pseudorhodoferax soli]RCW72499.1 putative membrane protein [Pseudorhodoferax soli]
MAQQAGAPLHSWRLLRPHALRPCQFFGALGAIAAWLLLVAGVALGLGYWPVALCCALALAAAVAGFVHAARHALDGEQVHLHADGSLEVWSMRGSARQCQRLPVAWLRVEADHAGLRLSSGGRRVCVATQLGAVARARFAAELRAALRMPRY